MKRKLLIIFIFIISSNTIFSQVYNKIKLYMPIDKVKKNIEIEKTDEENTWSYKEKLYNEEVVWKLKFHKDSDNTLKLSYIRIMINPGDEKERYNKFIFNLYKEFLTNFNYPNYIEYNGKDVSSFSSVVSEEMKKFADSIKENEFVNFLSNEFYVGFSGINFERAALIYKPAEDELIVIMSAGY